MNTVEKVCTVRYVRGAPARLSPPQFCVLLATAWSLLCALCVLSCAPGAGNERRSRLSGGTHGPRKYSVHKSTDESGLATRAQSLLTLEQKSSTGKLEFKQCQTIATTIAESAKDFSANRTMDLARLVFSHSNGISAWWVDAEGHIGYAIKQCLCTYHTTHSKCQSTYGVYLA